MIIIPVKNTIMNSVTYILYAVGVENCVLVDCGEWETLKPVLESIGKQVKAVLLTHGHSDHIGGLNRMMENYPDVEVFSNEYGFEELRDSKMNLSKYQDCPFTVDGFRRYAIQGGEVLSFEGIGEVEVLATPGHSPSCLSYKIGMDVFTGDAYIPGVKVYTGFPKADKRLAEKSFEQLTEMERMGCVVHCGHHSYEE